MTNLKDKNLYYVGGAVRDEILGIPSFDTDFCYLGNAIDFAEKSGMNIIKRNPDFGTVRVLYNDKEIDLASTREETYPKPGHLPVVKNIGCSLDMDLKRRDFTVNAMAKNTVSGELIDYFGGLEDIKNKKIRVLHDRSYVDDPTRIIRGLKFSVRFGFELEEETKKLQDEYLNNINYDMSYHRIKKELIETFNLNNGRAFDMFVSQGIYKLLGENQVKPTIRGSVIETAINEKPLSQIWLVYMSFFNLSKIPLTRAEKRIVEGVKKLETQPPTNNTPPESIFIRSIIGKIKE